MEGKIHSLAELMWGWPTMGLFLFVGLLYTVRLRGIQFRRLPEALRSISTTSSGRGMSTYTVLCTALAATIGTGNIVGVATALSVGGPGALLWMIVAAVLGMGTQFAEGYLAVRYRPKEGTEGVGGPFSYMERGLGKPWLGKIYCYITVGAGLLGVGTITQINSITNGVRCIMGTESTLFGYPKSTVIMGIFVTLGAGLVLLGGANRIVKVCETLVPFMSVLYLGCSFILLFCQYKEIPQAIHTIVTGAFSPKAVMGAGSGICIRQVLRMGIGRGVFTNEAGMGTGAITAAASHEQNPMKQGLITMSATFIDTILICTLSGLALVVTGAWNEPLEGGELTNFAWAVGLPWRQELSSYLLVLCLVFFAFATIIGWSFYGERCLIYLTKGKGLWMYRVGYLLALAVGPYLSVTAVFDLADILNAMMAVPNLTALLFLQKEVVEYPRKSS